MLWDSDSKDESNERGWSSNRNPVHPQVTPVLVPSQSGATRAVHQTVPVFVPNVEELKEQFQQQQNMLTQIKETIKENESQLSSKGKKVEAYANRLSQIRARTKNTDGKLSAIQLSKSSTSITSTTAAGPSPGKPVIKRSSKESLAKESGLPEKEKPPLSNVKLSPKGKIGELKKRLQESKLKFEERAGKEVSETKKIESIVENLRMQLEERDVTIQELQKIIEQPPASTIKSDTILRKSKGRGDGRPISTKSTQTTQQLTNDESTEILALRNRMYELESNVLDLEESLKEKESVIEARTQAVTLLSQDLSLKGKNTLDSLEETRQEMRAMQNNFIIIENQLKTELVEKDDRLTSTEQKLKKLESINLELSSKNVELQEKLSNVERQRTAELESSNSSSSDVKAINEFSVHVRNDDRVAELTNKINALNKKLDDSNKSMIKMKLEHKNKVKSLNKTIEKLKEGSDDKAEILRLQTIVDEFEVVKVKYQNKIAELEEEKATEKHLKDRINELESIIQQHATESDRVAQIITNLEKDKSDLSQCNQDQSILVENLYAKIQNLESESATKDTAISELRTRLTELEDEHKMKMDAIKSEHAKAIESLESYYIARMTSGGDRKEFEEYRITSELNNVQVEEQIEMLIREKQQLLEKLKNLSGVSSTESMTFETVEHSEVQSQVFSGRPVEAEHQTVIAELKSAIDVERRKVTEYQARIEQLEETIRGFEKVKSVDESPESTSKSHKSSANIKNKIKKMQTELIESRKTIQEQTEKLKDLNMKLDEKEQLIRNYIERIELFEKDDWGRENDWKPSQDEYEHVQELQKKCLSFENSLIELTEDCERLRKENIEVVHLLSEEKVKRKKLMERYHVDNYSDVTTIDSMNESVEMLTRSLDDGLAVSDLGERMLRLIDTTVAMEERLRALETDRNVHDLVRESEEKLEWTNIVLTSKETEMFRLQNLLEDSSKAVEDLERELREARERLREKDERLAEIVRKLEGKERQIEELEVNFGRLQDSVSVENERTASNEAQLKQLMETVREMESDAVKKENELKDIQGILSEKNLDIHNLKQWLEQVNSDLTYGYKEHLENMDKCLRDREADFEALLKEKTELEDSRHSLLTLNEDAKNQIVELSAKIESLHKTIQDKDTVIEELTVKLASKDEDKPKDDDLKLKVKRLAANLKKKVQNEKDLLQQIKEYEEFIAEKEKILQKLQMDLSESHEKWVTERSEKDQVRGEVEALTTAKLAADTELAGLRQRLSVLESELSNQDEKTSYKFQQMETQLQKMYENSERARMSLEQNKVVITELEVELSRSRAECEESRKVLAETCGKFEEAKFKHEEAILEKEKLSADISGLRAKIQEQMAVIESLETELSATRERLGLAEERRFSLENKTEDMMRRIEEDAKNHDVIEELRNQIQGFAESEERLLMALNESEERIKALEQELKEMTEEKTNLEKEARDMSQKLMGELERLRGLDAEKTAMLEFLTGESDKMAAVRGESQQKTFEIEKLREDVRLLEADLRESVENSKEVARALNYKIEELMRENTELMERNFAMKERQEEQEQQQPKRKKSVTFKTDEADYIRDLKGKIHEVSEDLKKANEETETLRMELFRERLRHEVAEVLSEAKDKVESFKSSPVKKEEDSNTAEKFDEATFFHAAPKANQFDQQVDITDISANQDSVSVDYESLTWDDGWGTEGHLEEDYLSTKAPVQLQATDAKCQALESELRAMEDEKRRLEEELQTLQSKYAKALKKIKEQKTAQEKIQSELMQLKSESRFGGLDSAIMDELRSQIASLEQKERETAKALNAAKLEKESLLKRIEVLTAGHDKFVEMKERQDNEMEVWETKNRELLREIAELRNELKERPTSSSSTEEKDEERIFRELRNRIEGLEWENCELKEEMEEKMEVHEIRTQEFMEKIKELEKALGEGGGVVKMKSSDWQDHGAKEKILELEGLLSQEKSRAAALERDMADRLVKEEQDSMTKEVEMMLSQERSRAEALERDLAEKVSRSLEDQQRLEEVQKSIVELEMMLTQERSRAEALERDFTEKLKMSMEDGTKERITELELLLSQERSRAEALERDLAEKVYKSLEDQQRLEEAKKRMAELDMVLTQERNRAEMLERDLTEKVNRSLEDQQRLEDFQKRIVELEMMLSQERTRAEALERDLAEKVSKSLGDERHVIAMNERIAELEMLLTQERNKVATSTVPSVNMSKEVTLHQQQPSETRIFDYFKADTSNDLFSTVVQPIVEPEIQRSTVSPVQAAPTHPDLDSLKQENQVLKEQLSEAQTVIGAITQEKHDMAEKYRAEYESALSFNMEEKNSALGKVYELEQALATKIEELNGMSTRVRDLDQMIAVKEEEVRAMVRGRQELEQAFGMKEEESSGLWRRVGELEKALRDKEDELLSVVKTMEDLQMKLEQRVGEVHDLERALSLKSEELARVVRGEGSEVARLRQATEELHGKIMELEETLRRREEEVVDVRTRLGEAEQRMRESMAEYDRQRALADEYCTEKEKLEDVSSSLRTEVQTSNLELEMVREEVERMRWELEEEREIWSTEKEQQERSVAALRKSEEELEAAKRAATAVEAHVERLKSELKEKESDIFELGQTLEEEQKQLGELREVVEEKDREIADLKKALEGFQEEISSFRNFEKQMKELRMAQIKETGSNIPITAEGDPDFTNWTEHELAELNSRLQSDLDTALYMLHQRDIRCDELTFELMQLLEERDTLQLRLSTAIRINEELRSLTASASSASSLSLIQDSSKNLLDQTNDRQSREGPAVVQEDLKELAQKISQLHSVGYIKDKTIQDEKMQRHRDQMTLLGRVSDSDVSLGRTDSQSNWIRTGKPSPKVMHI